MQTIPVPISISTRVSMTRKVTFSSGHRYWKHGLSREENHRLYGPWASPYNHGHNYVLDVTVQGDVDPRTGMVVNIKRVDDVLKGVILSQFDQKSINDEIPYFVDRSSSVENILLYISETLENSAALQSLPVQLTHLKLEEYALLYGELDLPTNTMTLTRIYEFAASHRLNAPALSHDENLALFGKCNNAAGHGHNYLLEVTVQGQPDPSTGMMVDIGELDAAVNRLVVDRYDHKNLNEDLPEFAGGLTSSEVVAQKIFLTLDGNLPAELNRIRLHETARNIFEISR